MRQKMETTDLESQTGSYEAPHCEVIELQSEGPVLAGSIISGGSTDGGGMEGGGDVEIPF